MVQVSQADYDEFKGDVVNFLTCFLNGVPTRIKPNKITDAYTNGKTPYMFDDPKSQIQNGTVEFPLTLKPRTYKK